MKTSAAYKEELRKVEAKRDAAYAQVRKACRNFDKLSAKALSLKRRLQAAKKAERDPRNRFPFSRPAAAAATADVAGV